MPEAAIIVGCFLVDLISKAVVAAEMALGQTIVLIPKFLNLSYTLNEGAAFGSDFGLNKIWGESGTMIFFIVLTVVAVGFFGYLLFKNPKKKMLYRISFSLIIGGALGNLYDRIFLGAVRDFIQFEYFGLEIFGRKTFAIFNIADSCVVIGAILLIIFFLFFDETLKKTKKAAVSEEGGVENSLSDHGDAAEKSDTGDSDASEEPDKQ